MKYNNLHFFDKSGNSANLLYNALEDKWSGKIFLPKISVGLFEVFHLYILESFVNNNNNILYGFPTTNNESTMTGNGDWMAYWKPIPNNINPFMLFQFDSRKKEPVIEKYESISIELDYNENVIDTSTGMKINNNPIDNFIQLNIAFNSEYESVYENTLLISDTNGHVLIEIEFYGESIGEDERLKVITNNFGYNINTKDSLIFKDYDINESNPDYILLNRKRKESLLEGHNIFPFIGTYKSLINAIKFYGYDKLTVHEYWQNVNIDDPKFGKYIHSKTIDIFDNELDFNDNTISLPNKNYRKTNKFALHFRINEIEKFTFDEYDLPLTVESFDYTIEEALIKLYALKNKLRKDYLATNSKIVDIMGVGDYFTKNRIRILPRRNRTDYINVGINPSFIYKSNNYIEDLRTVDDILFAQYTPYLIPKNLNLGHSGTSLLGPFGPEGKGESANNYTVDELKNVLLAYFTNYSPNLDTVQELPDKEGIPVGCPVMLENTSFSLIWDDATSNWNELNTGGSNIYDFQPINPGTGDIFTIREVVSGESVSYTSIFTDSAEDVCEKLKIEWDNRRNLQDLPWLYFNTSVINTTTGYVLRVKGIGTQAANVQIDFVVEVINGFSLNNQEFIKKIRTEGNLYNWDNAHRNNFVDIEWTIWKNATDTPEWYYNARGDVADFEKHSLVLPYSGNYNVELKLYDLYNQVSNHIKYDVFKVESREVEFVGFYKYREYDYYWNANISWNQYTSYWDLPILPNTTLNFMDVGIYESLDRVNAILNTFNTEDSNFHIQNYQNNGEISIVGPYHWDNIPLLNWNDLYHLWWDSSNVTGDTPANFDITQIVPGQNLYLEDSIHTFGLDVSSFQDAADELNSSQDKNISKYIYNVLYNAQLEQQYIHASCKYFGEYGDFKIGVYGDTDSVIVENVNNSKNSNFTWNDTHILQDGKILPKGVFLTFVYDKCKIPGKTNPSWKIVNTSDPNFQDIYFKGKYLTYLFQVGGNYSIYLELEDTNGNKKHITKNTLIIK